jgi:hypothetical protein
MLAEKDFFKERGILYLLGLCLSHVIRKKGEGKNFLMKIVRIVRKIVTGFTYYDEKSSHSCAANN